MREPSISIDGNCPRCASGEWLSAHAAFEAANSDKSIDSIAENAYAPPLEPDQYASKGRRLSNCTVRLKEAPKVSNCLWLLKAKFDEDCAILQECHDYERAQAVWGKSRVCQRCSEFFVTRDDCQSATASFDVPTWQVEEGIND